MLLAYTTALCILSMVVELYTKRCVMACVGLTRTWTKNAILLVRQLQSRRKKLRVYSFCGFAPSFHALAATFGLSGKLAGIRGLWDRLKKFCATHLYKTPNAVANDSKLKA